MKLARIHPRIQERLIEVQRDRGGQVLDAQMRVYCQLTKASNLAGDLARWPADEDSRRITADICASAKEQLRQLSIENSPGEVETLRGIYNDLEHVSKSILQAIEYGRSPRRTETGIANATREPGRPVPPAKGPEGDDAA